MRPDLKADVADVSPRASIAGRSMRARRTSRRRIAGVTLVEIAVLIGIVGVLAAVAVPRFFDDRTFLQRGYYEELAAALKYARKIAVASKCPVRVQVSAGGYRARRPVSRAGKCDRGQSNVGSRVPLADGQLLSGTSPIGVSASPGVTLTFDARGRTDLTADQPIAVGQFALIVKTDGDVQTP